MANDDARENWTGGAAAWLDNDAVFDLLFAPVTDVLLEAGELRPGDRLLEIGCGSGAILEHAVRHGARAVGIDISPGMVEAARRRVPEARVVVGDAQVVELADAGGLAAYDVIASRFGVMFFADPVAAFGNLRAAADPRRGVLVFACWGPREANPMFSLGTGPLLRRLDALADDEPLMSPDGPGPTSLSDPAHVRSILTMAGWTSVGVEPIEFACDYGFAGTDGVEERLGVILGTTNGRRASERLRPALDPQAWGELLNEARDEIRDGLVDGVVRHPASAWLVTARSSD